MENGSSISIAKSDITKALNENISHLLWTFHSKNGSNVRFNFHEFGFYWSNSLIIALEIGDGLIYGSSSRLVHFRGLQVPNVVTSVSNTAWMKVHYPKYNIAELVGQARGLNLSITTILSICKCYRTVSQEQNIIT